MIIIIIRNMITDVCDEDDHHYDDMSLVVQLIKLESHNREVPSSIPAWVEMFFWVWVNY